MIRALLIASCLCFAAAVAAAQDSPTPQPATAAPATAATATAGGDIERGRVLAYTCQGCHGVAGYTNAYPNYHVPMIGGQSEPYLVNALTEYQQGGRKHPTMQAQAEGFSDRDIADGKWHYVAMTLDGVELVTVPAAFTARACSTWARSSATFSSWSSPVRAERYLATSSAVRGFSTPA